MFSNHFIEVKNINKLENYIIGLYKELNSIHDNLDTVDIMKLSIVNERQLDKNQFMITQFSNRYHLVCTFGYYFTLSTNDVVIVYNPKVKGKHFLNMLQNDKLSRVVSILQKLRLEGYLFDLKEYSDKKKLEYYELNKNDIVEMIYTYSFNKYKRFIIDAYVSYLWNRYPLYNPKLDECDALLGEEVYIFNPNDKNINTFESASWVSGYVMDKNSTSRGAFSGSKPVLFGSRKRL